MRTDPTSLAARLDRLPEPLPTRLRLVAEQAGGRAWLVGGWVRDWLLDRPPGDLDLVVEGSAAALARRLPVTVVKTTRFQTVTIAWPEGETWDLVTARREVYPTPAALPEVEPADLNADLARRDFSVNALALTLVGPTRGQVLGAVDDLRAGVLRALHPASFRDDPTRLFRAVRYAVRLGFTLEPKTRRWFDEAVAKKLVERLTPDRLRHELERSLNEGGEQLAGLAETGLLATIDPELRYAAAEAGRFARGEPGDEPWWLGLLLTAAPTSDPDLARRLAERLRPERAGLALLAALPELARPPVAPSDPISRRCRWLESLPPVALALLAARQPEWRESVAAYDSCWRHITPALSGEDLLAAGVARGPAVGRWLSELRELRLDGRLTSRDEELARVQAALAREADDGR